MQDQEEERSATTGGQGNTLNALEVTDAGANSRRLKMSYHQCQDATNTAAPPD